jgi:hypothetical protein
MQARHAAAVTPARGVAGGRSSKATPRSAAPRRALAQPPRAAGQGPLDGIIEDPLLRRALREPVAFAGGMLAGVRAATRRRFGRACCARCASRCALRLRRTARSSTMRESCVRGMHTAHARLLTHLAAVASPCAFFARLPQAGPGSRPAGGLGAPHRRRGGAAADGAARSRRRRRTARRRRAERHMSRLCGLSLAAACSCDRYVCPALQCASASRRAARQAAILRALPLLRFALERAATMQVASSRCALPCRAFAAAAPRARVPAFAGAGLGRPILLRRRGAAAGAVRPAAAAAASFGGEGAWRGGAAHASAP